MSKVVKLSIPAELHVDGIRNKLLIPIQSLLDLSVPELEAELGPISYLEAEVYKTEKDLVLELVMQDEIKQ